MPPGEALNGGDRTTCHLDETGACKGGRNSGETGCGPSTLRAATFVAHDDCMVSLGPAPSGDVAGGVTKELELHWQAWAVYGWVVRVVGEECGAPKQHCSSMMDQGIQQ